MNIVHGKEAQEKLKSGIDKLANAVKSTLGPNGKNVIFSSGGMPLITKDGVTVARNIMLDDPSEQIAVTVVRQAAMKTDKYVGDGTTTSTVLTQAICTLGMEALGDKTLNVHELRKGIQDCAEEVKRELKKQSKPVDGKLDQVATISANNDKEIGTHVSEAVEKAGPDGIVVVEESKSTETSVEEIEGMEINRGYVSPYMMNNEKQECILHAPLIAVTDRKLSLASEILPLMENVIKTRQTRELLLICESIEGDALATAVTNKMQGKFNLVVVHAPGVHKKEILQDIASYVDTEVISEEVGLKLSQYTDFGSAEKVIITKEKTLFMGGRGDTQVRIDVLKNEIERLEHDHQKEAIRNRIAALLGKVIVIKVGGATEAEMHEKKYLYEDAVGATKAALRSGIIAGGGTPFYHLSEKLELKTDSSFTKGYEILLKAIQEPLKAIIHNSGQDVDRVLKGIGKGGYDAKKDEYVDDMIEAGIIDPLEVAEKALDHAVSVATTFLTTSCLMYEEKKD